MRNKINVRLISGMLSIVLLFTIFMSSAHTESVFGMSDTSPPGITTPPAVNPPTSITAVQVVPIADQAYSGKSKKPSVKLVNSGYTLVQNVDYKLSYRNNKNPGIGTVRVEGIYNYSGGMDINFNIVINAPKKVKIKKNQKVITASWSKVPAVTGYKVYFASNSSFTKNKKVKNIKSQKKTSYSIKSPVVKKTYFVKVLPYKTIKGRTYYGKVSTIKKLKTKNEKWIEVDLSKQKIYLRKGKKKIKTYIVSTGKKETPTIKGTFYIYKKHPKKDMIGRWDPEKKAPEYIQKDVKWAAYFEGAYAFHATYWHNKFGERRSHGCVNMKTKEAKFLYKWAPMGTRVVVHK